MRLYSPENNNAWAFAHVIVGALSEAAVPIGVPTPTQHDHGKLGVDTGGEPVGGPDPVEQRDAAAVLQAEVEHDQLGLAHVDRAQPPPPPRSRPRREAVPVRMSSSKARVT
jgi:hypothetical protein